MPEQGARVALRAPADWRDWRDALWPALVLMLLALWARYWLIEPPAWGHRCQPAPWVLTCAGRSALIELFAAQRLGWCAVALAALAWVLGQRLLARLALALAGAGLVLYCAEPSVAAILIAMLVLARR